MKTIFGISFLLLWPKNDIFFQIRWEKSCASFCLENCISLANFTIFTWHHEIDFSIIIYIYIYQRKMTSYWFFFITINIYFIFGENKKMNKKTWCTWFVKLKRQPKKLSKNNHSLIFIFKIIKGLTVFLLPDYFKVVIL